MPKSFILDTAISRSDRLISGFRGLIRAIISHSNPSLELPYSIRSPILVLSKSSAIGKFCSGSVRRIVGKSVLDLVEVDL